MLLFYKTLNCKRNVYWHYCLDHIDKKIFLRCLILCIFLNLLAKTYSLDYVNRRRFIMMFLGSSFLGCVCIGKGLWTMIFYASTMSK